MLNLDPLGMAAVLPIGGDESDVQIKRWVLKLLLPALIIGIGFTYRLIDNRFVALESAPSSNTQMLLVAQRVDRIEQLLKMYEELRMLRERQIAQLEQQNKMLKETVDQMRVEMNGKLDRLLYGRSRGDE